VVGLHGDQPHFHGAATVSTSAPTAARLWAAMIADLTVLRFKASPPLLRGGYGRDRHDDRDHLGDGAHVGDSGDQCSLLCVSAGQRDRRLVSAWYEIHRGKARQEFVLTLSVILSPGVVRSPGQRASPHRAWQTGPMSAVVAIDELAVAGFRRGDDTAVRRFYDTYGRMMFAVALRVLGDRGLAEEATQQAFVQAWRAASSLDGSRDPAPWLATIVRRVAIDIQRREARRPATAIDEIHPGHSALTVLPPSAEQAWAAAPRGLHPCPDRRTSRRRPRHGEVPVVPRPPRAGQAAGPSAIGGRLMNHIARRGVHTLAGTEHGEEGADV
jgi:RNA polymerase sigma factor (sigma-70 family)